MALSRPELSRLRAGMLLRLFFFSFLFFFTGTVPATESGFSPWFILIAAIPSGGDIIARKCWSLTGIVCSLHTWGTKKSWESCCCCCYCCFPNHTICLVHSLVVACRLKMFRANPSLIELEFWVSAIQTGSNYTLVCVGLLTTADIIYPLKVSCVNSRHYF